MRPSLLICVHEAFMHHFQLPRRGGEIIYIGDARFVKASNQLVPIDHAHDYVLTATTLPATCTENGSGTYTCSVCQDTVTSSIPPTGHSMTHHAESPAR